MKITTVVMTMGLILALCGCQAATHTQGPTRSVIIQGSDSRLLAELVERTGGEVTHELGIIRAVAAELTAQQREQIVSSSFVTSVVPNRSVVTASVQKKSKRNSKAKSKSESEKKTKSSRKKGKSKSPSSTTSTVDESADQGEPASASQPGDGSDVASYGSSDGSLVKGDLSDSTTSSPDFSSMLSNWTNYDEFPQLVDADRVHDSGITGEGVTVAFLDTGLVSWSELALDPRWQRRILAQYDAVHDEEIETTLWSWGSDENGHGTHMTAVAVSGGMNAEFTHYPGDCAARQRRYGQGIWRARRGIVRERDPWDRLDCHEQRAARYSRLESVLQRAGSFALLGRPGESSGIACVAGRQLCRRFCRQHRTQPDDDRCSLGNVPYVLTVGAMTDNYTPDDRGDDRLTTFSSAGPTAERFVKPDVLAPGGHITALMDYSSFIARNYPEFHDKSRYFTMSGTSQAAAIASGLAALVLQNEPALTPDDLKCRIMAGARPAVTEDGDLGYSVFQQGAGLVNAYDAVFNQASGCAMFWNNSEFSSDSFLWNSSYDVPMNINTWVKRSRGCPGVEASPVAI